MVWVWLWLVMLDVMVSETWRVSYKVPGRVLTFDVSYADPQAHEIINVALHWEYSPGIVFVFFPRDEGFLSCLKLTQRVISMSTTRLYRGYVNLG
jgi:hypothetical protein